MNKCGTILIVTLWILVILTVFALALGQRASLEVKLAGYARDKLRATELAKAAIERAIYEKLNDTVVKEVDALSENWANNEEAFHEFRLDDETFIGTLTASYSFRENGEEKIFYGMEDEESKININTVDGTVLKNLLSNFDNAEAIAASIIAWRNPGENLEEDSYYGGLDLPYKRKKAPFTSVAELLLVQHIRENPAILYGEDKNDDGKISPEEDLARYLTVFGEGKVNINTASKKVLLALTNNDEDLVGEIIKYRKGDDQEIGTVDDDWFATSDGLVNLLAEPAKNLQASYTPDSLFDVTSEQRNKLQNFVRTGKLAVNSSTYTIYAQAEVNKVKSFITATIKIDQTKPAPITYLFWQKK